MLPGLLAAAPARGQCSGCANASFGPALQRFGYEAVQNGIAIADFDQDGFLDIALPGGNVAVIQFGDGHGGFERTTVVGTGEAQYPTGVWTADLNSDGLPDLLVTASGGIFVYVADGQGGYTLTDQISDGGTLAVADFNGDGRVDVVTVRNLYPGNGDGTFGAPIPLPGGPYSWLLTTADFNGDGHLDVAVSDGSAHVLLGDGQGGFSVAGSYSDPMGEINFGASADFNGDGHMDLAVFSSHPFLPPSQIVVLLGDGTGGLTLGTSIPNSNAFGVPLIATDVDGDGITDLVVGGSLTVYPGLGGGAFGAPTVLNASAGALAVADFTGDGKPDVALASYQNYGVSVLVNDGAGVFLAPPSAPVAFQPGGAGIGRFHSGGHLDLVVSSTNDANLYLYAGSGNGQFAAPDTIPIGEWPGAAVTVADFNNDGHDDVAVNTNAGVAVLLGDGNGNFGAAQTFSSGTFGVASGDLDGDGNVDLVTSGYQEIEVLLGDGSGGFAPAVPISLPVSPGASVVLADVNGDGHLDVLIASGYVYVLLGNGDGTFGSPIVTSSIAGALQLVVGDWNGDGHADLAVSSGGETVWILLGDGTGQFGPPSTVVLPGQSDSFSLHTADFNGDGHADLAVDNLFLGEVDLLMGDGTGAFVLSSRWDVETNNIFSSVGDWNEDGRPDLAEIGSSKVTILLSTNCMPRRLGMATNVSTCDAAGSPFPIQPAVGVYDDGGNVVACDTGDVTASLVPGSGSAGAILGGNTTVAAAAGIATFENLSVDLPGTNYLLEFAHAAAGATRSRAFSVGVPPGGPGASNSGPFCQGQTLSLYATTVPGAVYRWTGPNGFSSTIQNPVIPNAPLAAAGVYSVTAIVDGCTSAASLTTVAALPPPAGPTIVGYSTVCSGSRLLLRVAAGAYAYHWFLNGTPIPGVSGPIYTVSSVSDADAGAYTVSTSDATGCTSALSNPVTVTVTFCYAQAEALAVDPAGNGILEPGETAIVDPTWMNRNIVPLTLGGAASNFTGPSGATYTITSTTANYGTIAPQASVDCQTASGQCYAVTASFSGSRPATHWDAYLDETLDDSDPPRTWILHIGQSFDDVAPTSPVYPFVERILHNGITAGCASTTYCPQAGITRAQMAVLLLRARHGPGYVPPPATGRVFTDVPADAFAAAWIEELAYEGITAGCGGGAYCPSAIVNRSQMAVFLLRAKWGSGFGPPACTGVFADVSCPGPFTNWIEELYHESITGGCGTSPLVYCPDNPNSRGQMAVFITKAFSLLLYGP